MSEVGSTKWIEVLLLLVAGVGFYVWQMRDLRRAREASHQQAQAQAQAQAELAAPSAPAPALSPPAQPRPQDQAGQPGAPP